jgi:hypothetical protein
LIELLASGRIVDFVLTFMVIELGILALYRVKTGRGIAPIGLLLNQLAGFSLMLAARGALIGGWWGWTAGSLILALLAHGADLRYRWSR